MNKILPIILAVVLSGCSSDVVTTFKCIGPANEIYMSITNGKEMQIRGVESMVDQKRDAFSISAKINYKKQRALKSYEISDLSGYSLVTFYYGEQKLEVEYFKLTQLNNSPYREGFVSHQKNNLQCHSLQY
tara:strand:+ start:984 stop:1376 length:393 start_codon:yes stop_codon:yes gene_type:complete